MRRTPPWIKTIVRWRETRRQQAEEREARRRMEQIKEARAEWEARRRERWEERYGCIDE